MFAASGGGRYWRSTQSAITLDNQLFAMDAAITSRPILRHFDATTLSAMPPCRCRFRRAEAAMPCFRAHTRRAFSSARCACRQFFACAAIIF